MLIRSRVNERIVSRRPSFLPSFSRPRLFHEVSRRSFCLCCVVCTVILSAVRAARPCAVGGASTITAEQSFSPFRPPQSVSTLSLSFLALISRVTVNLSNAEAKSEKAPKCSPLPSVQLCLYYFGFYSLRYIRRVKVLNPVVQHPRRGMFFGGEDDFSVD